MSYNNDELEPPEWVNSNFFKLVLENSENCTDVKIINYKVTPATMVGDHFVSIMFRVNIQYSTNKYSNKNISIIIKTLPELDGLKRDMMNSFDFFETERVMYIDVLPKCVEIVKNVGIVDLFVPRLLYHSNEPHEVFVFEDLKELGYFMYPLSYACKNDLKLIFSKLAQLHASTFKMEADGNTEITKLKGTCFNVPNIKDMDVFISGIDLLLELLETLPELKSCAEKIKKIKPGTLVDKCIETFDIPSSYNVLNHGDYQIKNMMFKNNDEEKISKVVLLDFQLCHWGSPAYDLTYMGAFVPYESREEIFKHYFNCFIDFLNKSECTQKLPTFDQLQEELHKFRYIDFFMISSFAPFMAMDRDKIDFQMEDMLSGKVSRSCFYRSEKYISQVKKLLPSFLEKGYYDDLINAS